VDGAKVVFEGIELVDLGFPGRWLYASPCHGTKSKKKADGNSNDMYKFSFFHFDFPPLMKMIGHGRGVHTRCQETFLIESNGANSSKIM
jgi:hypothetical protein